MTEKQTNIQKKLVSLSGLGTKVDSTQLDAAVDAYLELESTGSVSKSEIGRRLGLERAPEWLDSPIFLRKLDVARFTKEVNRLRGVKELVGLLDHILDAALIESMKRLMLAPETIPSSVLFSETLIKLVRLRHELAGSAGPKSPANVWINIKQEINDVSDPLLRRKLWNRLLDDYNQALKIAGVENVETVDTVGVVIPEQSSEPSGEPSSLLPALQRVDTSVSEFDDPASG